MRCFLALPVAFSSRLEIIYIQFRTWQQQPPHLNARLLMLHRTCRPAPPALYRSGYTWPKATKNLNITLIHLFRRPAPCV